MIIIIILLGNLIDLEMLRVEFQKVILFPICKILAVGMNAPNIITLSHYLKKRHGMEAMNHYNNFETSLSSVIVSLRRTE